MSKTTNVPPGQTPPAKVFGPYSPVRHAHGLYFTAGQVGIKDGKASNDVREQTAQALKNLADVLAGVDLRMDDIIKTTIFVTDMGDFAAVNEVYMTYFAEPRPARSTVAVQELPRLVAGVPLKVEIEAVACKGANRDQ